MPGENLLVVQDIRGEKSASSVKIEQGGGKSKYVV